MLQSPNLIFPTSKQVVKLISVLIILSYSVDLSIIRYRITVQAIAESKLKISPTVETCANYLMKLFISIHLYLNDLVPVLRNGSVGVGLDPAQETSDTQVRTGPVQLTAESQTEGDNTNLGGATISLDDAQWAAAVTGAGTSDSTISADVIVGDDGRETSTARQIGDDWQTDETQELRQVCKVERGGNYSLSSPFSRVN